jgi:ribosomal protein S18 acetylase RimI-like enzyme
VSLNVEARTVGPGEDDLAEEAWRLKERIREGEDVLKQRRGFFLSAYRRSHVYLFLEGSEVIGFAVARRDGYILFLGVAPEHRGEGLGERLVARVADEFGTVTCHARASNESALAFYRHIGFQEVRNIRGYYEDGGDAYYLKHGDSDRLLDRLSQFLRR